MYPNDIIRIPREQRYPRSDEILYLISTTDNYNVFSDITLDVKTNLLVFTEALEAIRDPVGEFSITTDREKVCVNFVSSWFVYGNEVGDEQDYCNPRSEE